MLKPGAPVEPIVLRVAAGECLGVRVRNRLPAARPRPRHLQAPSRASSPATTPIPPAMSTFNNNLIRPSSYVGLHPALVAYDVNIDDGMAIGATGRAEQRLRPHRRPRPDPVLPVVRGDISLVPAAGRRLHRGRHARRVRRGQPLAGRRHQAGAEGARRRARGRAGRHRPGPRPTPSPITRPPTTGGARGPPATSATLNPNASEPGRATSSTVIQKGLGLRYRDGTPVEMIAAEGNIAEDAEDSGHMAINYRAEPLWYRFGLRPNAPLVGGDAATPASAPLSPTSPAADLAFSNQLTGGRPGRPHLHRPGRRSGPDAPPHAHRLPAGLDLHACTATSGSARPYVCPGFDEGRARGQVPGHRLLPDAGGRGRVAAPSASARSATTPVPRIS